VSHPDTSAAFEGLAGHLEEHLGPVLDSADAGGFVVEVRAKDSMASAVTDGVRHRLLPSALPVEFACSVRSGQASEAALLVRAFADRVVRSRAEVEYDDGFAGADPLIEGSELRGLIAAPHPRADEMFNLFRNASGELRLQFITLIPITGPEAEYLQDHETGELFELWKSEGTDLLDVYRASAV
jgi:Suppressor of fused protein (SUFU)